MLDQSGTPRPSRPLLRTLLGDVLRRTRLDQGRTLADVARDARVSMPYLSEVERGRKEASSEVLASICGALRIGLADLLAASGRELADSGADRGRILRFPAPYADGAGKTGTAADAERETADPAIEVDPASPAMHLDPASAAMHLDPARPHAAAAGTQAVTLRPPEPVCLLAA